MRSFRWNRKKWPTLTVQSSLTRFIWRMTWPATQRSSECHLNHISSIRFFIARKNCNSFKCCRCFCRKCKTCSSKKQSFICGSDNRTYSSLCRMDYHNCVHNTAVKSACKGFCPCKGNLIIFVGAFVVNQKIRIWIQTNIAPYEYYPLVPHQDVHPMECQPQELSSIGNRLLDWFSVIMADSKKQKRRMAKSKGSESHIAYMKAVVILTIYF